MKDDKGNDLVPGDRVRIVANYGPPELPMHLVGTEATVLRFARKNMVLKADEDVYGERAAAPSMVRKLA